MHGLSRNVYRKNVNTVSLGVRHIIHQVATNNYVNDVCYYA